MVSFPTAAPHLRLTRPLPQLSAYSSTAPPTPWSPRCAEKHGARLLGRRTHHVWLPVRRCVRMHVRVLSQSKTTRAIAGRMESVTRGWRENVVAYRVECGLASCVRAWNLEGAGHQCRCFEVKGWTYHSRQRWGMKTVSERIISMYPPLT